MIQRSVVVNVVEAQLLISAAVVAAAVLAVTVSPGRLLFWWSWAPGATAVTVVFDFVLCFVVCGLSAYAAGRGGWAPTGSGFVNGAIPAVVGSSAARRAPKAARAAGDASVFGLVHFGHGVLDEVVDGRIQRWTRHLSDERLLDACARLDAAGTGTASSLRMRRTWREQRAAELIHTDGHRRREARAGLERAVSSGTRRAKGRRPT